MRSKRSMRRTFFIFCLVIIILVLGSISFNVVVMRSVFVENTNTLLKTAHEQTVKNIENYLRDIENIAFSMCYSPSVQQYFKETDAAARIALFGDVQAVFSNISYGNNTIMGFSLYDKDGVFITANANTYQAIIFRDRLEDLTGSHYYTHYPSNPYLGDTLTGYILTIPVIGVEKGVLSKNTLGAVTLTVGMGYIEQQMRSGSLYRGSAMTLIGETGKTVLKSGDEPSAQALPVTDESAIGQTGWKLITSYDPGILPDDMQRLWWVTVAVGVLIILTIATFLIVIFKRMLAPVEGISRFMRGVSKTKQSTVYRPREETYEELTAMTDAMNQMLSSLDEKTAALIDQEKKYYHAMLETNRLEILAYRSQINPHFLYNTLDCISGIAFRYNAPEIVEISEALSGMFRYAVKGEDFVTVSEEIKHMQEYATIISYRFMGRIAIDIKATQEAQAAHIPRLMLQPVVENAVFHGLERKMGPGKIEVSVAIQDAHLHMRIADNGIGMDEKSVKAIMRGVKGAAEQQEETGGIGLWNIARRLDAFCGGQYDLTVRSAPGEGTTVTITLPLKAKGGGWNV